MAQITPARLHPAAGRTVGRAERLRARCFRQLLHINQGGSVIDVSMEAEAVELIERIATREGVPVISLLIRIWSAFGHQCADF